VKGTNWSGGGGDCPAKKIRKTPKKVKINRINIPDYFFGTYSIDIQLFRAVIANN
jgi:hypothetical protein